MTTTSHAPVANRILSSIARSFPVALTSEPTSSIARTERYLENESHSYRLDADARFIQERRMELERIGARLDAIRASPLVAS